MSIISISAGKLQKLHLNHKNKINKHLKQRRKLWSTIDDIAQYKPEKTTNRNLLAVRTTPQAAVNYVNKYFVSIGQSI